MSVTDYVIDILLIVIIFRHMRERELTAGAIVLPLVLIAFAGQHYLHTFTLGGNDLALIVLLVAAGAALGSASGLATSVRRTEEGIVVARATWTAAATWIIGMGSRFAFAVWVNTAAGADAIGTFSRHHSITSGQAWTTALVFMAFAEVLARVAVMQTRRVKAGRAPAAPCAPQLKGA